MSDHGAIGITLKGSTPGEITARPYQGAGNKAADYANIGTISGVTYVAGSPRTLKVEVRPDYSGAQLCATVLSREDGTFEVHDLPKGRYRLTGSANRADAYNPKMVVVVIT